MLWAKVHGATTHFPVALVLCAVVFDGLGLLLAPRPLARDFHVAGYWAIALAALGSFGAVGSGILLSRGSVWGHGVLRMHHLFVWPAFALLVGLAGWRVAIGHRAATRRMLAGYLFGVGAAAALVSAAAYWGGELLLRA